MTEEKNPPTPRAGIFLFLGKRKKTRRAFHIPTAPATAVRLVQNLNLKGASSTTVQAFPQAHSSIGKDYLSAARRGWGEAHALVDRSVNGAGDRLLFCGYRNLRKA